MDVVELERGRDRQNAPAPMLKETLTKARAGFREQAKGQEGEWAELQELKVLAEGAKAEKQYQLEHRDQLQEQRGFENLKMPMPAKDAVVENKQRIRILRAANLELEIRILLLEYRLGDMHLPTHITVEKRVLKAVDFRRELHGKVVLPVFQ